MGFQTGGRVFLRFGDKERSSLKKNSPNSSGPLPPSKPNPPKENLVAPRAPEETAPPDGGGNSSPEELVCGLPRGELEGLIPGLPGPLPTVSGEFCPRRRFTPRERCGTPTLVYGARRNCWAELPEDETLEWLEPKWSNEGDPLTDDVGPARAGVCVVAALIVLPNVPASNWPPANPPSGGAPSIMLTPVLPAGIIPGGAAAAPEKGDDEDAEEPGFFS